jgi:hypothetical protein
MWNARDGLWRPCSAFVASRGLFQGIVLRVKKQDNLWCGAIQSRPGLNLRHQWDKVT